MQPDPKIFYRRRLPHYQPPGETFHVTFRLAGSLPREAVQRMKEEREDFKSRLQHVQSAAEHKKLICELGIARFRNLDRFLDHATEGPLWLRMDLVAAIVSEELHVHDGTAYDLLAYCLMPNHVHLLAMVWEESENKESSLVERSSDRSKPNATKMTDPEMRTEVRTTKTPFVVTNVLRKIKGVTAFECNKLLNRRGAFWQHESYDHVVRDDAELDRTILYILENPVKAGLCAKWSDWRWTYVKKGLVEL